MAFTTSHLATMNAVKVGYVSHFFSSSFDIPNEYLCRRLSQTTTRRVQTSCCYRGSSLKAVAPFMMSQTETRSDSDSDSDGIGIVRFLKGKSYFVTGATWFLAKVLIEKLLRESPEIGKIFLLVKSNDQESANKRLYDEIISSDMFKLLKQTHGSSYENFMKSKLIPITGDIGEDNLGMDSEAAAKISEEIDVIISCAGRTTFDDRYDSALSVNALGPGRLLNFGEKCKKLKLFLHFSTAYVTGNKEGTVLETPLCIGKNITSDLNIEYELKLALEAARNFHGSEGTKKLKELGIERAQQYGWENTYAFTKAIGESVIHSKRADLHVVIIRPSIIESSYKKPFPGWIEGIRMADPIILAYGKGQISDFLADDQSLLDLIPVDMVVNATIAAMAKHGCGVSELNIYNVTSTSHVNSLRFGKMMDYSRQYLRDYPWTETATDLEPMKFHSSFEDFRFDDTNTRSLIHELSMEERKMFDFDVEGIDWEHYIVNIHLPGLKMQFIQSSSS